MLEPAMHVVEDRSVLDGSYYNIQSMTYDVVKGVASRCPLCSFCTGWPRHDQLRTVRHIRSVLSLHERYIRFRCPWHIPGFFKLRPRREQHVIGFPMSDVTCSPAIDLALFRPPKHGRYLDDIDALSSNVGCGG